MYPVPVRLGVPGRRREVGVDPGLLARPAQLGVQVLPLAHPQVVEVLAPAHPAEGAPGHLLLLLCAGSARGCAGREVGGRRCGTARVPGPPGPPCPTGRSRGSWIDNAATMTRTSAVQPQPSRLQEHPSQPRVDGEPGQCPPVRREPRPGPAAAAGAAPATPAARRLTPLLGRLLSAGPQRAELLEQPDPVGDLAGVRRVHEREPGHLAEPEGRHLEDDRRQVGPQDLGLGELRPGLVVLLGVQADADPVGDAAAAARALVRAGLRDRLDREALDLGPLAVARDAGRAGVDDIPDAGNGQRGLGDVGGEDDPPAVCAGRTPGAARPPTAGRTAAGPRCAAGPGPGARRRRRGSRARPERNTRTSGPCSGAPAGPTPSTAPRRPRSIPVTWSRSARIAPSSSSSTRGR